MNPTESTAVLLLSHGSRDPRAEFVVGELVSAVSARTSLPVRAAHLGFTAPTAEVALRQLAAEGITSVRVVPLLFTPGYHLTHDVPLAVEASGVAGWVDITVAPPLLSCGHRGRDLLRAALAERLVQAGAGGEVDALVLASAGSSSQAAGRRIAELARDLERTRGVPVITAFASAGGRSTTQALEAFADRGFHRPAVASLFVAPGRLTDLVAAACQEIPVADPLGVSPVFVEMLVAQARAQVTTARR